MATPWTNLTPISEPSFQLPKRAEAERTSLNGRIEEILRQRRLREDHVAQIRAADPTDCDVVSLAGGCELMTKADLEQREYALRADLDRYYSGPYAEALAAAVDSAYQDWQTAQSDIRTKLADIGYRDEPPTVGIAGSITPGHVACHPKVAGARERHETLQAEAASNEERLVNLEAMKRLRDIFEERKRKALAEAGL